MHYLYILYSNTLKKFYVGHTGDTLEERLRKHNSNHKGFTGGKGDWVLEFYEIYTTKELAYLREREIKKWKSSKKIESLIRQNKPGGFVHPDL